MPSSTDRSEDLSAAAENGEKTFAPSEKRKRDAAKRGDVLRSREVTTAIAVSVGAAWSKFAGPWVSTESGATARAGFSWDRGTSEDFSPDQMIVPAIVASSPPVSVSGGSIMAASLGSQIGLSDGRWVGSNLAPKASRINPLSGSKRMLGSQGWIESGKGSAKLVSLGSIAYLWMRGRISGRFGSQRIYRGEPGAYHSGLDIAPGGGVGVTSDTGEPYTRARFRAQKWWPIGKSDVSTVRGEVGRVWANGNVQVPDDFGFRTGGARSIRGYKYQSIGSQRDKATVGAPTSVVGSIEYDHYFNERWGMGVFVDAGDAAQSFGD
ncbi:hypothetical protein OY671_007946, partial [Metschnikowia pulcherrima]